MLITSNNITEATSTVLGGVELFSDTSQTVVANAVSATDSRTYGIQLNSDKQAVVNVPWSDTDTNTFPTTYTWTGGTTAGPTASITGTSSTISVAAVPSASSSASGIVTTGAQTFAGVKTFAASSAEFLTTTSTQDGIILLPRVGGTTSLRGTITPGVLTASRTYTLPDVSGTLSINQVSGSANIGAVQYNGTVALDGTFNGNASTPTGTARLNYEGYFFPTYLNLSGSIDAITASTHYFVETGTDGYVRPKTLANVKTEIVTSAAIIAGLGYTPAPTTTALDDAIAMSIALG